MLTQGAEEKIKKRKNYGRLCKGALIFWEYILFDLRTRNID
jgi:hypothetical protein